MGIERVTKEEMHCSMGGCSNLVRDVGMREGEGVYTIEEIAIDAGWKIEEFNGGIIHVCPRCSSDCDALTAERDRLAAENAELRSDAIRDAGIECRLKAALAAANATLDRLREAVPEGWHWCEDCRCDRPPMPAAGPWRTDVENAQFTEGQEYLIEYTHPWYPTEPAANYRGTVFYVAEHDHFTHPCHGIITRDRLRAFATINRPETTHDHP